ncbi:MAG: hypothetical protein ACO38U_07510 [Burkholderiaceae bacterium]
MRTDQLPIQEKLQGVILVLGSCEPDFSVAGFDLLANHEKIVCDSGAKHKEKLHFFCKKKILDKRGAAGV